MFLKKLYFKENSSLSFYWIYHYVITLKIVNMLWIIICGTYCSLENKLCMGQDFTSDVFRIITEGEIMSKSFEYTQP